jgi:phosphatidylglycerophosphate synthase
MKKESIKVNSLRNIEDKIHNVESEIKKEILFNVPNSLTFLRLLLSFVFVYLLFNNYSRIILFVVFVIAAITDWFDGFFARKLKQTSNFGARFDQIIDRIFTVLIVGSIIVYLVIQKSSIENIFSLSSNNIMLLLFLSVSREIIGSFGVLILLIRNRPTYKVKYIGKVTTFMQSVTFAAIIIELPYVIVLAVITCVLGIFAGIDYLKSSLNS